MSGRRTDELTGQLDTNQLEISEDARSRCSRYSNHSGQTNGTHINTSVIYPRGHGYEQVKMVWMPLKGQITDNIGKLGQPMTNYHTKICIGTPPQEFRIEFDIDLNDYFVPCYSWKPWNRSMKYHKGYRRLRSETGLRIPDQYMLQYQNCTLFGKFHEDNIRLESIMKHRGQNGFKYKISSIAIRQKFLAVEMVNKKYFHRQPVHGYFGLGPANHDRSILVKLQHESHIDRLYFSLWFNSQTLDGQVLFGGADKSRFKGQIYWHESALDKWSIPFQRLKLGAFIIGQACCWTARLSSAVNEILGPASAVKRVYNILGTKQDMVSGLACIMYVYLYCMIFKIVPSKS